MGPDLLRRKCCCGHLLCCLPLMMILASLKVVDLSIKSCHSSPKALDSEFNAFRLRHVFHTATRQFAFNQMLDGRGKLSRSGGGGGLRNEGTTSEGEEGKKDGNEGTRVEACVCLCVCGGGITTAPPQSSFVDARIRVSSSDLSSSDKHLLIYEGARKQLVPKWASAWHPCELRYETWGFMSTETIRAY